MDFDTSKFKTPPFRHQIIGVEHLLAKPAFALLDEMGSGKTKQVIDSQCILFEKGEIDTVVIVCPAAVRVNYLNSNPEIGEIAKHCWVPYATYEFHSKGLKRIYESSQEKPRLAFVVTNYEFLRTAEHQKALLSAVSGRKVTIVMDESSFIKNHKAAQTKGVYAVRSRCRRAILLNGTPVGNSLIDLYAQFQVLSTQILKYTPNYYTFRNRYCKMGGYMNKQIVGYYNVPELQSLIAPYAIRRLKEDCLDLPEKLYSVMEAPMGAKEWSLYRQMRDEMVAWLDDDKPSIASQAIVKVIRLSQLTSGFLGGIEDSDIPATVGNAKEAVLLSWVKERVEENPNFRLVIWTRFRMERQRLAVQLQMRGYPIYQIYGGQPQKEREKAIAEFSAGKGLGFLLGQPQAGGFGLNLTTAHYVVYMSNDYSLMTRLQSEDRVHRPGQKNNVLYFDMLATGPDGQKTVDHAIVKALRKKEEVAEWTTSKWRQVLMEE